MEKSYQQLNQHQPQQSKQTTTTTVKSLQPAAVNNSVLSQLANFESFRFVVPKSPFRFGGSGFGIGAGNNNSKTTEDERLALIDRFLSEGLDVRKWTDSQKLPHVWRWLSDAEINCHSLRHQIEKMRHQHREELHEIEDYIEQVWKLSTERLLTLEDENRHLRQITTTTTNNNNNNSANSSAIIGIDPKQIEDNNNLRYHCRQQSNSIDYEEDEDDGDSDIDLQKNLCYGFQSLDLSSSNNNHHNQCSGHQKNHHNNHANSVEVGKLSNQQYQAHLVTNCSSSTSSLASSVATGSTGVGGHGGNNLCDSLKLRSSKSYGQLANNNSNNSNSNGSSTNDHYKQQHSKNNNNSDLIGKNYCEKCEILFEDFNKLKSKYSDTIAQLDDCNEKNFILEKLNRCIEIENENFAYKLAESEDRSNQLERRILLLEKECRQLKSKSSSTGSMISNGSNGSNSLVVDRRLIDELNGKVKSLEEKLDHRLQLYEELEDKYRRQKEKHKETMWKLRHYMEEVKLSQPSPAVPTIADSSKTLSDSCLLQPQPQSIV